MWEMREKRDICWACKEGWDKHKTVLGVEFDLVDDLGDWYHSSWVLSDTFELVQNKEHKCVGKVVGDLYVCVHDRWIGILVANINCLCGQNFRKRLQGLQVENESDFHRIQEFFEGVAPTKEHPFVGEWWIPGSETEIVMDNHGTANFLSVASDGDFQRPEDVCLDGYRFPEELEEYPEHWVICGGLSSTAKKVADWWYQDTYELDSLSCSCGWDPFADSDIYKPKAILPIDKDPNHPKVGALGNALGV